MGKNYVALNEVAAWYEVLCLSQFVKDPPTSTPTQLPLVFTRRNVMIFTFRATGLVSHRTLILAHYEQAIFGFVKEVKRYMESRKVSEI
jgi:hypothetical protein